MEFTAETPPYEMVNALTALPSIEQASLFYTAGFLLVFGPFLLAWGTAAIIQAVKLIGK